MASSTLPLYLLRDEYIDQQNRLADALNHELKTIRTGVDHLHNTQELMCRNLAQLHDLLKIQQDDNNKRFKRHDDQFKQILDLLEDQQDINNKHFGSHDDRFDKVDDRFDKVDDRFDKVDDRFDKVDDRFDKVDDRLDRIEARLDGHDERFDRLEVEVIRFRAYMKNSLLKNPILRIDPVPALDPKRGIIYPETSLFPQHANQFYALRRPRSTRERDMLLYLARFYDIPPGQGEFSDESSDDDQVVPTTHGIVASLEGILGLDEDKFIKFRARAHQMAQQPAKKPSPKSLRRLEADNEPPPKKQNVLGEMPKEWLVGSRSSSGKPSEPSTKLGWKVPTLSVLRAMDEEYMRRAGEGEEQEEEQPSIASHAKTSRKTSSKGSDRALSLRQRTRGENEDDKASLPSGTTTNPNTDPARGFETSSN